MTARILSAGPAALSLVAGKLALDFTNTESGRESAKHLDHLQTAADLVAWAAHAKIIGERDASLFQRACQRPKQTGAPPY